MREADRQASRERRERDQRHAERIVRVARRVGGQATAVTRDDLPGVVSGDLNLPSPAALHEFVRELGEEGE
jgi:hypothetical protein